LDVQRDETLPDRIDIRISTFPSTGGEKVVMRILDRSSNLLKLETLGLSSEIAPQIHDLLNNPHGFFLVTGPTGSGKTTTLYAMLSCLNNNEKNIVTMEDPVEYDLHGITQSQVNLKTGFTFENGLRSILRQDPDIIMIGEIRDKPTVQIAIESALTGHLVLSTLHTNDAAGAITRLLDMGIEPFLISATVSGILAQRLAKRLCDHCKELATPTSEQRAFINNYGVDFEHSYISKGCTECNFFGHRGRIGIFELLKIDDTLRAMIIQKVSASSLRDYASAQGMKLMMGDALEKVAQGLISMQELWAIIEIKKL
jgi:type II secretory ATPase GspE/PulE/Tfp pilus assembly ATPase PilB-like protein